MTILKAETFDKRRLVAQGTNFATAIVNLQLKVDLSQVKYIQQLQTEVADQRCMMDCPVCQEKKPLNTSRKYGGIWVCGECFRVMAV